MGSTGSTTTSLQLYGRSGDAYKSLFPMPANVEEANEIARFNYRIGRYQDVGKITANDLQEKTVRLSELSNSQLDVRKSTIDELMRLGINKIQAIQDTNTTSDIPYVVKYGNTQIILDGHHRLTAMRALGATTARVKYLDLEQYMKNR